MNARIRRRTPRFLASSVAGATRLKRGDCRNSGEAPSRRIAVRGRPLPGGGFTMQTVTCVAAGIKYAVALRRGLARADCDRRHAPSGAAILSVGGAERGREMEVLSPSRLFGRGAVEPDAGALPSERSSPLPLSSMFIAKGRRRVVGL